MTLTSPHITIEADQLRYQYGRRVAVDGFSARMQTGVVGVLGPNGAGKTTALRILAGQLAPSAGSLEVSGEAVDTAARRSRLRERCGYLPQDPSWLPSFRVSELVSYFAQLRLERARVSSAVERALGVVGMIEHADRRLGQLSGGERQRAFLAQSIVHDPEILILDEPTSGLDPVQRVRLREFIAELGRKRLVVLSSHLVEDVQHLAGQLIVISEGRSAWAGTTAELLSFGDRAADHEGLQSRAESGLLAILEDRGTRGA